MLRSHEHASEEAVQQQTEKETASGQAREKERWVAVILSILADAGLAVRAN